MASVNQHQSGRELDLIADRQDIFFSDSDDDGDGDDDDDDGDTLQGPCSLGGSSGIDIDAIIPAKKVEFTVTHQVEAGRSVLALVVDDEYLFAGLEGGDITVCTAAG